MTGNCRRLELAHPRGRCYVTVGIDAIAEEREALADWVAGRRVFLVTTPRVRELHGEAVLPILESASQAETYEVPDGEGAKSIDVAADLWRWLVEKGGKRDSRLITFGGGSVGDLGGFVAGCFLRGIEYVQLPTTLLAQVDASIGGKTAIDLESAKNSVGLFHHPRRVVADVGWLASLPEAEIRSGLFEVVKMGFLLDPGLFERVERELDHLREGDPAAWVPVVAAAARAKIGVVQRDPEEADERRLLNFGHTLAHALETAAGYSDLRHGEAVGWGMRLALRLSLQRGLDRPAADRLERLIQLIGLPDLPTRADFEAESLIELMGRDKKAREDGIAWVLAEGLGRGLVVQGIPRDQVVHELQALLAS